MKAVVTTLESSQRDHSFSLMAACDGAAQGDVAPASLACAIGPRGFLPSECKRLGPETLSNAGEQGELSPLDHISAEGGVCTRRRR